MASEEENLSINQSSSSKRVLLDPTQYIVIHNQLEEDESEGPSLACQFEEALEKEYPIIVIEPLGLGNESIRWIKVGNFLHKSAVISGFTTLCAAQFVSSRVSLFTILPLGMFSMSCAFLYGISWQYDPCCKYQVDYRGRELTRIPSGDIQSPSPVVLVRRNDRYRKILHNTLSAIVFGHICWTLYKQFS